MLTTPSIGISSLKLIISKFVMVEKAFLKIIFTIPNIVSYEHCHYANNLILLKWTGFFSTFFLGLKRKNVNNLKNECSCILVLIRLMSTISYQGTSNNWIFIVIAFRMFK